MTTIKAGRCFDSEFYEDQKDPLQRTLVIERMRVRKSFYDNEKRIEARKARQFAREMNQKGDLTTIDADDLDFLNQMEEQSFDDNITESPFKSRTIDISSSNPRSNYKTRSASRRSIFPSSVISPNTDGPPVSFMDTGVQTDEYPYQISTRKEEGSTLCHQNYLQAGVLMCAVANMSPSQAVMGMYIMDKQVHGQERLLPLKLDKSYQSRLDLMKKLQNVANTSVPCHQTTSEFETILTDKSPEAIEITANENESDAIEEQWDSGDEVEDAEDVVTAEVELNSVSLMTEKVKRMTNSLEQRKRQNKTNLSQLLPAPESIRRAHRVAACFLEGEVGKEMTSSGKVFLMPDGTSRAKVGRMGASLVQIDGKMRALKLQFMGNEKAVNWADTIIFQLERLATASDQDVKSIYQAIVSLVSDSCKVNKGLATLISGKLGLKWIPGQLFCCLHTVLGFQTGMENIWQKYQVAIGHDKMYPSITGFELDMNDKLLPKQVLECFLRLTADRWQARTWNRFEAYTKFVTELNKLNLGQELHGNRFGDFERCCAIGVYSLSTWTKFVDAYSNIRNQLSIFLRDTMHLSDINLFLWLGPALLGIHLSEPYIFLLLELKVTHHDLLKILPQLHEELMNCPKSLIQLSEPAFPSLSRAWINPFSKNAPYPPVIAEAILEGIDKCDKVLLGKYLRDLSKQMGIILKRQRGNAYGFGDDKDSPELVTRQLSSDALEQAPTTTKQIENYLGIGDSILERFGGQAFDKAGDDLIIKYSKDLLNDPGKWCNAKMRRKAKKIDDQQKEFTAKQKQLVDAGVTPAEIVAIESDNKVHRVVEFCRKNHNGPINSEEELDALVATLDEKKLKSALTHEIRYRKFTTLNIKDSNPLFKQRNLSNEEMATNLRLLLHKTDMALSSTVTMEDLEQVVENFDCNEFLSENDASVHQHPFRVGEFIAVNFVGGYLIGEVVGYVDEENIKVNYMRPKKVRTADVNEHPRRFWYWPRGKHAEDTRIDCILPVRPSDLILAVPPSTGTNLVFRLDNVDILDRFCA